MTVAKMDFRPGGMFHHRMAAADGKEMWGRFVYREILPPAGREIVRAGAGNRTGRNGPAPGISAAGGE